MGEARGPAEDRYQLPAGTYRELIVKDRTTKFLKEQMRELREDPQGYRAEDKADEARRHHADETARVKAAADQEVAAGRPIVVLAWQVQVTRYAHRWSDAAPSWLTTPTTAIVRVFADDTCEPASI
jgi:hypothetical protein